MLLRCLFTSPLIAVLVGWLCYPAASSSQVHEGEAPPPNPVKLPAERPFQLLGTGSCAASGCHNSGDPSAIKSNEYALCIKDSHSRAYSVLLEDRSRKIEHLFHQLPGDWKTAQPERDVLCLRCHVHPDVDRAPMREIDGVRQFRLEDGVSCEACHGPAERWLDVHHRPQWTSLSVAEKSHFGMTDTRDIESRAKSCVDCHIGNGAKGMDVGHDLIAAGHPRLAFEFSGDHSLMTKHWDDAADRDSARGGNPNFEALAWMKGQAVSLKASLELLKHRAANSPVLDFAEFDCFACHHDLKNPGPKQNLTFPGRGAGQLTWNPWAAAQAEASLELLTGQSDVKVQRGVQLLHEQMSKLSPDKKILGREIAEINAGLDRALLKSRETPPAISLREAMTKIAKAQPQTWDAAAQTYNGLVAMEKARLDRRQHEIVGLRPNLAQLRQRLVEDSRYRLDVDRTTARILQSLQAGQR